MEKGKRELQKERTRRRILDVAYRAFSEKGIEASNTADIASAANLSHGAIFVHFKTRQEIVLNVIDAFASDLCDRINQCAVRKRNAKSILLAFTSALAAFEDFYVELLLIMPKLPESAQGSLLLVHNGFAERLLPAIRNEMDGSRFKQLGEAGVMNAWFALLHYYLTNRNWYVSEGRLLDAMGAKIVNDYLNLLAIGKR